MKREVNELLFDDQFNGDRLRLAREFTGLQVTELASEVSASRQFLHAIESGKKKPSDSLVEEFAAQLGFLPGFFFSPLFTSIADSECNFRKQRSAAAWERKQARAFVSLYLMLIKRLESILTLQPTSLPDMVVRGVDDVEAAAISCRRFWGLGTTEPISDMTRILETCTGSFVADFPLATRKIDAFSVFRGRGVVVRSTLKRSTSRSRFDLAHELAHIVLHRDLDAGSQEFEDEANRFAGAFLIPEPAFRQHFPRSARWNWTAMVNYKRATGVSLKALIYRARDLRMINEDQFRRGYMAIQKRWGNNEPGEPKPEHPVFLKLALDWLKTNKELATSELACEMGWGPETFRNVTGHAVEGSGIVSFPEPVVGSG